MPKSKFEAVFRGFVEDFGGEIVPEEAEDGQRSADYFFRQHNVVAELKCLVVDQTADTKNKLSEIIDQRRAGAGQQAQQPCPDDILLPFTSADGEKFNILFDETESWSRGILQAALIGYSRKRKNGLPCAVRCGHSRWAHSGSRAGGEVVWTRREGHALHAGQRESGRLDASLSLGGHRSSRLVLQDRKSTRLN